MGALVGDVVGDEVVGDVVGDDVVGDVVGDWVGEHVTDGVMGPQSAIPRTKRSICPMFVDTPAVERVSKLTNGVRSSASWLDAPAVKKDTSPLCVIAIAPASGKVV